MTKSTVDSLLARWMMRLERGRCGRCGSTVNHYEQDGANVIAQPCGCKMGQGVAASMNKAQGKRQIK